MPQQSTVTSKKSSAKSVVKSKPAEAKSTVTKSTVKRQSAKSSKDAPASAGQNAVNGEDRHSMIATTAYYRAERRGFNAGCETEDWLEAEAEIDSMLYH